MAERWYPETGEESGAEEEPLVENPDRLLHETVDGRTPPDHLTPERVQQIEWAFLHSPEIQAYRESGTTMEDLEAGGVWLDRAVTDHKLDPEVSAGLKERHAGMVQTIERYVHEYAHSVRGFKLARFGDRGEDPALLGKRDVGRKSAHDVLVDSARAYNRFMSTTLHREHHLDAPEWTLFSEGFFPPKEARGARTPLRDPSKDWALSSDYYLRVRDLLRELKQRKTEQTGSPAPLGADEGW